MAPAFIHDINCRVFRSNKGIKAQKNSDQPTVGEGAQLDVQEAERSQPHYAERERVR